MKNAYVLILLIVSFFVFVFFNNDCNTKEHESYEMFEVNYDTPLKNNRYVILTIEPGGERPHQYIKDTKSGSFTHYPECEYCIMDSLNYRN